MEGMSAGSLGEGSSMVSLGSAALASAVGGCAALV